MAEPIIKLESYQYNDGTTNLVSGAKEITITQTICTLNFSYTHDGGDRLKYYQFSLYDKDDNLLGTSQKVYSLANITYVVENYNNLNTYKLKLHCVTQSDNQADLTIVLNIKYDQNNTYADISFATDREKAMNNVVISVSQLTGVGNGYTYVGGEYVVIADDGEVNFLDAHSSIVDGFVAKLWCANLSQSVPFLKIAKSNANDYIEVFFVGNSFVAYKYSCGLKTSYISNLLNVANGEDISNKDIYFSIKSNGGRISMYATIMS